jgi:hypothetical protein
MISHVEKMITHGEKYLCIYKRCPPNALGNFLEVLLWSAKSIAIFESNDNEHLPII